MTIRTTQERRLNALKLLRSEVDLWVASASETGDAYLIPLSFYWDGSAVVMATPRRSRTAQNLCRAGKARVAIGPTRDVVIIEGPVDIFSVNDDQGLAEAHAEVAGFDARRSDVEYVFIRVIPERIQAWRNSAELPGREILGEGNWLSDRRSSQCVR